MPNKIFLFLLILILFSCNSKDCFEATGTIIQREFEVANFTKIEVGNEVTLILKQGLTQKVILETGENLINDIAINVNDNRLILADNNQCNLARDYAVTKVIVTAPNITEIRSNTARPIISEGILTYNNLKIIADDNFESDLLVNGTFNLTINNNLLEIVSNGNAMFTLKGQTNILTAGFYAGSSRLEAKNLLANTINIVQKSTNDMVVNPQEIIQGTIFNIGNIISYNTPNTININELYTGKIIFR